MKTRLLKRLRSSAKSMVYLVPVDGDMGNILVAKKIWNDQTRGFDTRYYYREIDPEFNIDEHLQPTGIEYHGQPVRLIDGSLIHYRINFRDNRKPLTLRWTLTRDEKGKPIVQQGGWSLDEAIKVLTEKRREYILQRSREDMEGYYQRKEWFGILKLSKY